MRRWRHPDVLRGTRPLRPPGAAKKQRVADEHPAPVASSEPSRSRVEWELRPPPLRTCRWLRSALSWRGSFRWMATIAELSRTMAQ
jgi:hypothetical protein